MLQLGWYDYSLYDHHYGIVFTFFIAGVYDVEV